MGLGDDLAASLAAVMPILRRVERLVAFDNRLTDVSVFRIVQAVQAMPALTYLGKMCIRAAATASVDKRCSPKVKHVTFTQAAIIPVIGQLAKEILYDQM